MCESGRLLLSIWPINCFIAAQLGVWAHYKYHHLLREHFQAPTELKCYNNNVDA